MATLYVYNFNNYYNRKLKVYNDVSDYGSPIHIETETALNFNPNDGVNTQVILGRPNNAYEGKGDYLIFSEDNVNITSRWFIIESVRTRGRQYRLSLHRDVLADNYSQVISADCFIEKATLPSDNPLIFNAENMSVNQIFTSQTLLKDETECGWLIGYYAKTDGNGDPITLNGTATLDNLDSMVYQELATPIEDWEYYAFRSILTPFIGYHTEAEYNTKVKTIVSHGHSTWTLYKKRYSFKVESNVKALMTDNVSTVNSFPVASGYVTDENYSTWESTVGAGGNRSVLRGTALNALYSNAHSIAETQTFLAFNRKIIKDSAGKYYSINIEPTANATATIAITSGSAYTILYNSLTATQKAQVTGDTFNVIVSSPAYVLTITEIKSISATYNIEAATSLATVDQPYNIFAIPYGPISVVKKIEGEPETTYTTDKYTASLVMAAIMEQQADKIYDGQLIGYCPVPYLITESKTLTVTDGTQFSKIIDEEHDNDVVGVVFNVPQSEVSLNIPVDVTPENVKLSTICDNYRLTAPDQSSYFEFNAAKNGGIHNINIDIALKPYNVYIHANPDFDVLYGQDFNTGRGLIYGTNCGLSRISDQWAGYQIQNSQFQNIFDRQVQNMEIKHKYEMIEGGVNALVGTAQGAATGAMAGAMAGPVGALAGGIIGGVASLAGGAADMGIKQSLYNENLDYTKDMFGYSLQNIKAQPDTLTKVTAINQNNTLFITLDYYTCTQEEKNAAAKKIAWNGMSVGIIGKLQDFIGNTWSYNDIEDKGYIKARLIRLDDIEDDFHNVLAIADELNKGVYIK